MNDHSPQRRSGLLTWGLLSAFIVFAVGCGGPKVYPVDGQIVYTDGEPAANLKGYKVEFESVDALHEGHAVSAEGEVKPDGSFQMTTFKPGDGVFAGKHRVIIAPPASEGDTPTKPHVINPRYLSYETSGLTATVEEKSTAITLTIERRKK
jgi:hypothetical protein